MQGFMHFTVPSASKDAKFALAWARFRSRVDRAGIRLVGLRFNDGHDWHAMIWFTNRSERNEPILGGEVEKLVLKEFPNARGVHVVDGVSGGQFNHEPCVTGRKVIGIGQIGDVFSHVGRAVFRFPELPVFWDVHADAPVENGSVGEAA